MVLRAAVIVAASGVVSAAFNATGPDRALTRTDRPVETVSMREARAAYDRGDAVFIDARFSSEYEAGHIPGARSLPLYEYGDVAEQALEGLSAARVLITYCNGAGCDSAVRLAERLAQAGFWKTKAFTEGWEGWREAGYPTRGGQTP